MSSGVLDNNTNTGCCAYHFRGVTNVNPATFHIPYCNMVTNLEKLEDKAKVKDNPYIPKEYKERLENINKIPQGKLADLKEYKEQHEEKVQFKDGKTGTKIPRFELIPRPALVALANRSELGTIKHPLG